MEQRCPTPTTSALGCVKNTAASWSSGWDLGRVWVGGALLPTMPFPSLLTMSFCSCKFEIWAWQAALLLHLLLSAFLPELPLHPGPWGSLSEDSCLPWPLAQDRLNSSVDSDLQGNRLQPQPNSEACVQLAMDKGAVSFGVRATNMGSRALSLLVYISPSLPLFSPLTPVCACA